MLIRGSDFRIDTLKLVIWDLDNTFWKGTISEETITPIERNIELIKELSRRGIVNSICSKNEYNVCQKELEKLGVWEYFVFPSIDWTHKSLRVHSIIDSMNLRAANTLFLDDEPTNLHRALSVNDDLVCAPLSEVEEAIWEQLERLKVDHTLARLQQYKDLQKRSEAKTGYDSDDEFLRSSDIRVSVCEDCMAQTDRIHDLINRTNQLNYTKIRISREQVEALLSDKGYRCGYVSCSDKFCDYGIVGFYAVNIQQKELLHFLFSCRTIGMGVEQFIYTYLDFPALTVTGEVVTAVKKAAAPDWIRFAESEVTSGQRESRRRCRILVKGPCDVSQIVPFFSGQVDFETEFAYVSQQKMGMYIESFNHTSQIVLSMQLSEREKDDMICTVPFVDKRFYETKLFSKEYDYIIFSLLTDYGLGLYRNRTNPKQVVAFGQYTTDYTREENWGRILRLWIKDEVAPRITDEYRRFREGYEAVGRISDSELRSNLQFIRDRLPDKTKLLFLNGAEMPYTGECSESLKDRHVLHSHLNEVLREFVSVNSKNCFIIDVNQYLQEPFPYLDTINHYKKIVYYRLAVAIKEVIEQDSGTGELRTQSMRMRQIKDICSRIVSKAKREIKRLIR